MHTVLLIARLFLALVFGVAGITKAADPEGSRRAIVGFGMPERVAGIFGRGLAFGEILIALSLIPLTSAWAAAVTATGLLLIFTATIAINLVRGRTPNCHCFGQLHSAPIGWTTLGRNIVLMGIGAFIVAQGKGTGLSALSWLNDLKIGEIVGLALGASSVVLLALTFAYLRRILGHYAVLNGKIDAMKKVIDEDYAEAPVQREDAMGPAEGLPIGAPAPQFSLPEVNGGLVRLEDILTDNKSVLLLFVSPNCFPCEALFPSVKTWEHDYRDQLKVALVSKGSMKDNQRLVEKHDVKHLLVQNESTLSDEYRAKWTPAAVLISKSGRIASQMAYGDEAIRALIGKSGALLDVDAKSRNRTSANGDGIRISERSSLFLGDVAPTFSIKSFEGGTVSPGDLLGRDTILLFWDPACSYCQQISDDILRWEQKPPRNAPRLVFVASGDGGEVEAESEKFRSLYLHDPEFEVAPMFGTSSTPSAVLIDSDGRIASSIAIGLPNARALLGIRTVSLPIASAS